MEFDPIMTALRAKQAAIEKHQKADPIASMAWLDLDDDDEEEGEEEERDGEDDDYVDEDEHWCGDKDDDRQLESGNSSESDHDVEEDGEKVVASEV